MDAESGVKWEQEPQSAKSFSTFYRMPKFNKILTFKYNKPHRQKS